MKRMYALDHETWILIILLSLKSVWTFLLNSMDLSNSNGLLSHWSLAYLTIEFDRLFHSRRTILSWLWYPYCNIRKMHLQLIDITWFSCYITRYKLTSEGRFPALHQASGGELVEQVCPVQGERSEKVGILDLSRCMRYPPNQHLSITAGCPDAPPGARGVTHSPSPLKSKPETNVSGFFIDIKRDRIPLFY